MRKLQHLADASQWQGLSGRGNVELFTSEPQLIPVAGPELGEAVRHMLETLGVVFYPLLT